jgi:hypothetical protein
MRRCPATEILVIALVFLAACGGSQERPNSAPSAPCDGIQPGVRVHVTAENVSASCWWSGGGPLKLHTNGGSLETTASLYNSDLDAAHQATLALSYPEGATAGPAGVGFYSICAMSNWQGDSAFTADPTACTDVDLVIRGVGLFDAGVPSDAAVP